MKSIQADQDDVTCPPRDGLLLRGEIRALDRELGGHALRRRRAPGARATGSEKNAGLPTRRPTNSRICPTLELVPTGRASPSRRPRTIGQLVVKDAVVRRIEPGPAEPHHTARCPLDTGSRACLDTQRGGTPRGVSWKRCLAQGRSVVVPLPISRPATVAIVLFAGSASLKAAVRSSSVVPSLGRRCGAVVLSSATGRRCSRKGSKLRSLRHPLAASRTPSSLARDDTEPYKAVATHRAR
jgi:hypothetical protein